MNKFQRVTEIARYNYFFVYICRCMSGSPHKLNESGSFLKKCFDTFVSFGKVILKSKPGQKLPVAGSEKCLVLGNGPSLKQSLADHPEFFKGNDLLCVNSFSVTDEYTLLKPAYYVMLDPGLWLGAHAVAIKTFEDLRTKTSWPLTLFIPVTARNQPAFAELKKANPTITIVFFNYTPYRGFKKIGHWLFRKNLAMPQSQNVLVAALFIAVNMKFPEVYVFGADHTWHQNLHINENNMLCLKDVHFYEQEEKISYRPFYRDPTNTATFTMYEILVTFSKVFLGYFVLNEYAKSRNCTIYNASTVSFIDALKRIKIQ